MTTEKLVNEALFGKTELASLKVELALTDAIKKYTAGYKKYNDEGLGLTQKGQRIKAELNEIISAMLKWRELGDSIANDMLPEFKKIENAAKELGIDVKTIPDYKDANDAFVKYSMFASKMEAEANKLK
jgi:hypothetical protein